ncbi:MAG: PD-(D/E)XK motif protein [Solirubrobacteraceae bacterium]
MDLDELWAEMERAPAPAGAGRLVRRIHPQAIADLHIALVKPADERVLMLIVPQEFSPSPERLPSTRGTRSMLGTPTDGGAIPVELHLVDTAAREIFGTLAADVAAAAALASTHAGALDAWIARLGRWQRLLARLPADGLSAEAQRGLYAELWTLREVVAGPLGLSAAIEAWTGPEPALHDFQHALAAIEVKSTAGAQHQVLRISSERQLDDTGTGALYLVHVSIDARQGGTETLSEIVETIREGTRGTAAEAPFEERLGEAGYFDVHARRYTTGYTLRRVGAYRVQEGFPRIVERDLLDGVGDVRYSVAVTECRDWERPMEELTARLTGADHG